MRIESEEYRAYCVLNNAGEHLAIQMNDEFEDEDTDTYRAFHDAQQILASCWNQLRSELKAKGEL